VRFLYHEVIRVPYILYVPRLARSPGRIRELVPASISVARTLLDVVGVKNDLPGVSLEPVLRGERRSFSPVFSEADSEPGVMGSRGATIALTDDRYKLVSYLEEPSDEGYDLADDPREQHILPKDREVYGERTKLAAWHDATGAKARIARQARAAQSTVRGMRDPAEPKAQRRAAMNAGRAKSAASAASEQSVAASPSGEQAVSPAPADAPLELPEKLKEQLRSLGYAE
jgi:arylsulfatase A-like enzyme